MGPKKNQKKAKKEDEGNDDDWEALAAALKEKEAPAPAADAQPAAASEPAPAPAADADEAGSGGEGDDADGDIAEGVDMSKLSKKDKEKLKKKQKEKEKKEKEKAEKAAGQKPAAAAEDKAEGGKKPSAKAKLIQAHLEAQRKAEEEFRRKEDERIRKEEEERLKYEEEERRKEEDKRKKKEKEKLRKEELKRQGKYLTKSQREAHSRNQAYAQMLMQSGMIPATQEKEGDTEAAVEKPKRVVYDNKRKKKQEPKKGETEGETAQAAQQVESDAEGDADGSGSDDGSEEGPLPTPAPAPAKEEAVVDSWEEVDELAFDLAATKIKEEKAKAEAAAKEDSKKTKAEKKAEELAKKEEAKRLRDEAKKAQMSSKPKDALRSPICCILGHVDTGKTKLLDKMRRTNVQEGEAGGITQQIGATYFPMSGIRDMTRSLDKEDKLEYRLPGLLIIDTPGHESFANLRSRGSSLCDIAILVVDIMHGLEAQTLESLNLLKARKTPFVVALNKVDRLYGWKAFPNEPFRNSIKKQAEHVRLEYEDRLRQTMLAFSEQGLNAVPYYKNDDVRHYVSLCPTSAHTGEGIPDLLMFIVQLTQKLMEGKLAYVSTLQCTVLEVKVIEGLGTTIDVILVNGVLHEGDEIVLCGMDGPIVTTIRALLTPHPMKEMRVKGSYLHHKEIVASQGIKIAAQGLESAVAGSQLLVVGPDDDVEVLKKDVMQDLSDILSSVDKTGVGVYVQASTLGSLEALLDYLKSMKVPVAAIGIGPIHKKDVMKASVMVEKQKEYAIIMAFDVKVTPEAADLAKEMDVKVFTADIIYHLFDQFTAYIENMKSQKRAEAKEAVFPCILKIFPDCVFNKKDPLVLGVEVTDGILKVGTPLGIPGKAEDRGVLSVGRISSIENNHKAVDSARKGDKIAVKIMGLTQGESTKQYGRHFDHTDALYSHISRQSIDELKENFREELQKEDWLLVVKLKKIFGII